MKRPTLLAPVLVTLVVTACGVGTSSAPTKAASPTATTPPTAAPTAASTTAPPTFATTATTHGEPPPHFDTPQAAMIYLAAAWNNNDLVALKHVTNPDARAQLDAMHSEATDLRLDHCDPNPAGDYTCHFRHLYPAGYSVPSGAPGEAVVLVGPAAMPGWYMTVFQHCG